MRRTIPTLAVVFAVAASACGGESGDPTTTVPPPATTAPVEAIHLRWDFGLGLQGWEVGFSDYSTAHEPMDVDGGIRNLPDGLGEGGDGLMVTGSNTSDDLFMFLRREVGPAEGLSPDTTYRAVLSFALASGAPTRCAGIGGAPGESVFVKAGVVSTAPTVDLVDGDYRFGLDKGNQSQGGADLGLVGDVANGLLCEEALEADPRPYRTLTYDYETEVTTGGDGSLWVVVGTDSGFEGITTLYYRWVQLNLEPL